LNIKKLKFIFKYQFTPHEYKTPYRYSGNKRHKTGGVLFIGMLAAMVTDDTTKTKRTEKTSKQ
jgi:hypothetical protein